MNHNAKCAPETLMQFDGHRSVRRQVPKVVSSSTREFIYQHIRAATATSFNPSDMILLGALVKHLLSKILTGTSLIILLLLAFLLLCVPLTVTEPITVSI